MSRTEKLLKHLYVLLGRICDIEQYVWEDINREEQLSEFFKTYDALLNQKQTSGRNLETRFTLTSVLTGALTLEDRTYKIHKPLKSHGDERIEIKGETILHRAISFHDSGAHNKNLYEIIAPIVEKLPFLLKYDRSESPEYDGQSPLHLAVLKEDTRLVKIITKKIKAMNNDDMNKHKISLDPVAIGSKFKGTVMMAGTPLCVAALTFNKTIFKTLVRSGANIGGTNKDSDNMCHSLIRYARYCPERLDDICKMIDFILKYKCGDEKTGLKANGALRLLMMENQEGLNPLQLATKLKLHKIFKQLYGFEVYCERHLYDSLRDDHLFDVTEIDTIPVAEGSVSNGETSPEDERKHASVLPAILFQNPQSAIAFLEVPPMKQVIELKWNRYKWFIAVLGLLHFVFMGFLTHSAVERTQLTNDPVSNPNESLSDPPNYKHRVGENDYVTAISAIGLLYSLIFIVIEGKRIVANYNKKVVKKTTLITAVKYPHSNIIYRWLFLLLSVCLVFDFVFAISRVERYENYCLIAAMVVGWYSLLFFIQMIRPFSFFTALIQTVMVDLFRFALVMVIMLFGFTTAMYMAMQGANTEDDTFHRYTSALMKMFTIMIGLGDIDSLFLARQPGVTVLIFTMFVLMTTILLLNAVLAIMSNTCSSLLSRYGNLTAHSLHYRLQKLSAILLIEDALPVKLQKRVGEVRPRKRYMNGKWYNDVKRRMLYHTSLTSNTPDEEFAIPGLGALLGYLKGRSNKSKGKKRNNSKVNQIPTTLLDGTATVGTVTLDVQELSHSTEKKNKSTNTNGRVSVSTVFLDSATTATEVTLDEHDMKPSTYIENKYKDDQQMEESQ